MRRRMMMSRVTRNKRSWASCLERVRKDGHGEEDSNMNFSENTFAPAWAKAHPADVQNGLAAEHPLNCSLRDCKVRSHSRWVGLHHKVAAFLVASTSNGFERAWSCTSFHILEHSANGTFLSGTVGPMQIDFPS